MRQQMRRFGVPSGAVPTGPRAGRPRHRRTARALAAAAIGVLALASPAMAQSGDGYLFGAPQGSLTLRGGFSQASAKSDIFDETMQQLTLSRRDFGGFSGGIEGAVRVAPSVDLTLDVGYSHTSAPSHYRNFVDNNNAEIQQVTALRRVPYTLNARLWLTPPGRSIGRFAWIPSSFTPWVEAGAGFMSYRFSQEGDFVDLTTNAVFPDAFVSEGTTPMAQGVIGADYTLTPRLALTGDARYLWAKRPDLGSDFVGYSPLDLSGVALSLGLTVRL